MDKISLLLLRCLSATLRYESMECILSDFCFSLMAVKGCGGEGDEVECWLMESNTNENRKFLEIIIKNELSQGKNSKVVVWCWLRLQQPATTQNFESDWGGQCGGDGRMDGQPSSRLHSNIDVYFFLYFFIYLRKFQCTTTVQPRRLQQQNTSSSSNNIHSSWSSSSNTGNSCGNNCCRRWNLTFSSQPISPRQVRQRSRCRRRLQRGWVRIREICRMNVFSYNCAIHIVTYICTFRHSP